MQAGKDIVAAANIGASVMSDMEQTKAVIQEKVEEIQADHPSEKEEAECGRDEKIHQAEAQKQGAIRYNTAVAAHDGDHHHPTIALLVHGTAEPARGYIEAGATESRPIGTATGTTRAISGVCSQHLEMRGTGGGYA